MNYFIEGLQGSGKTTAVGMITQEHTGMTAVREGDYSPIELAWCAYVDERKYREILKKHPLLHNDIEKNTVCEHSLSGKADDDRYIICYTRVKTDDPVFYHDLEQYEIYNGRTDTELFTKILLERYSRFRGDNYIFECSLFQNIVEDMILFRQFSDEEIISFYHDVHNALEEAPYRIIYLETEDIAENLSAIKKERSDENGNEVWFRMLCGFFNDSPYAKAHGLKDFGGIVTHLGHRQKLELRICSEIFPQNTTILRSKKFESIKL